MMYSQMLFLFGRVCLGILLVLNGPANVLAIGILSANSPCSCSAHDVESRGDPKQNVKSCCGICAKSAQATTRGTKTAAKNDIRPTCPICPSCPHYPNGCCVSCPCKAPCSAPLVFVIPPSPELAWPLANVDIFFSDSHTDELILPPRFSQFVAITI